MREKLVATAIDRCDYCPYIRRATPKMFYRCSHPEGPEGLLLDCPEIPDWCPLPDYAGKHDFDFRGRGAGE